mmetsp:Transcript_54231/g.150884  ORF Transcript_54231/g.150884 Transcript_54231/m.150884 type:complete len:403 (-) Transcript_54231:85-1293(-)
MAATPRKMEVAVALFERGFDTESVEKALNHCRTFEKSLAWLSRHGITPRSPSPRRKRPGETLLALTDGSAPKRQCIAASPTPRRSRASLGSSSAPPHQSPKTKRSPKRSPKPSPMRPTPMRFNDRRVTCGICCDSVALHSAVCLGCRHGWYCLLCMRRHAEARLATGAAEVQCPECREHIQEHDLRKLLPKGVIESLHARSVERAVASSSNLYVCPTPNCTMCVEIGEGEEARLEDCPNCGRSSCLRCGAQPSHPGLSCQAYARKTSSRVKDMQRADQSMRKWMIKTGTKQCPRCKMAVTKEHLESQHTQYVECHKMMCRSCQTRFCFKCLAVLTETYSCGCSIDAHGFIDPVTGRRINHLRARAKAQVLKRPCANQATGRAKASSAALGRGGSKSSGKKRS